MSKKMRIRAKVKNGVTEVKALMDHPMETGLRKNKKTGELIPAHFIQELTCSHNDKVVMSAYLSGGVSKNPYVSFKFKGGASGDAISMSWTDNKGEKNSAQGKIK